MHLNIVWTIFILFFIDYSGFLQFSSTYTMIFTRYVIMYVSHLIWKVRLNFIINYFTINFFLQQTGSIFYAGVLQDFMHLSKFNSRPFPSKSWEEISKLTEGS